MNTETTTQEKVNASHRAKYMLLLGPEEAPRALLFNGDHRYLAEVLDDDGMVVDHLVRSSRSCPTPRDLSLAAVLPPPAIGPADAVRCFALG